MPRVTRSTSPSYPACPHPRPGAAQRATALPPRGFAVVFGYVLHSRGQEPQEPTDMPSVTDLEQRLRQGEIIVLDGAMGTELERLGAPMHDAVWCAKALEDHPDLVREVHRSYIEAGADVITTNTYAAPRHALEPAGLSEHVVPWNARAAAIAREVRDGSASVRPVYVAGSVSTFGNFDRLDAATLARGLREQARILVEHGVDLLVLETLGSRREAVEAGVEAIADLGLPLWVSMSCMQGRTGPEVMLGIEESQVHSDQVQEFEPFGPAVAAVMARGGSAALMMHSDLKVTRAALKSMASHYRGLLGVYPNAGHWLRPEWAFVDQVSPEAYAEEASGWAAAGARIIGGCCGIGPAHIKAVHERVARQGS